MFMIKDLAILCYLKNLHVQILRHLNFQFDCFLRIIKIGPLIFNYDSKFDCVISRLRVLICCVFKDYVPYSYFIVIYVRLLKNAFG